MGLDIYTKIVVGVRIKNLREQALDEVKQPGCGHAVEETAQFCPTCGKPRWKTVEVPKPGFDKYGEPLEKTGLGWFVSDLGTPDINGVLGIQWCPKGNDETYIIPVVIMPGELAGLKHRVKRFLEDAGMKVVEPEIYVVTQFSY
jgi:hypothetical protein